MRNILSVVLIVIAGWATAQSYPEPSKLSVNDFAGIIEDDAEDRLSQKLDALREETDVELVVLTLSRQDMFAPDTSLKKFARGIFNEWGIGDKKRDDGILVLVLRTDQALRITLGKGYGKKAEKAADKAVDRSFLPEFREDRYEQGIETGVEDLIANVVRPYVKKRDKGKDKTAVSTETTSTEEAANDAAAAATTTSASTASAAEDTPSAATDTTTSTKESKGGGLSILLWIAGGIGAIIAFFTIKGKTRKCPKCGARGTLKMETNTIEVATEQSAGKGERITTCEKCDYRNVDSYVIPKREKEEPEPEPEPEPKPPAEEFGGGKAGKGGSTGKW
ncbi:MAG: TPM domain-containing protein [Roseovarius sp.]|nr:TPM domain-containing protein [Roseovarius sp.]